jgi:hypothetical protein
MNTEVKTFRDAVALILRAWRLSIPFFASIELWLMVLVAVATVGGVWLTALADGRAVLAFGFAIGYVAARVVLHAKRILNWPFI